MPRPVALLVRGSERLLKIGGIGENQVKFLTGSFGKFLKGLVVCDHSLSPRTFSEILSGLEDGRLVGVDGGDGSG